MNIEEKIDALATKRKAIHARKEAARQRVQTLQETLAPSVRERDRLQQVCTHFEETNEPAPPYEQFAKAAIAADRIAHELMDAEGEAKRADQEAISDLAQIDNEEIVLRREAALTAFREAVTRYERAIQHARLPYLADEVRRLASLAGVRLEERSPLLDDEYVSIAGYPLNIRAHSNLTGDSPLSSESDHEVTCQ